ncbi:MAG TPA: 50S ribosomal protein L24 [Kiritimatiellae bacterium]|nr:50S ribosomal protein L24 [Kiritimatiellia bacterium]
MGRSRPAYKCRIRKGDIVKAIAGDDADGRKTGRVLRVYPRRQVAIVEGFNLVVRHMRKSQDHPSGAIIRKEAPVAISNLKVVQRVEKRAEGSASKG